MSALVLMVAMQAATPLPAPSGQQGVAAAIDACDAWVQRPATWTGAIDAFPDKAGLAGRIVSVPTVPPAAMPPADWMVAPHYWYAATAQGGIYITVSDRKPLCNAIGGAANDLQPEVETALARPDFRRRWTVVSDKVTDDMRSTRYVSTATPKSWMLVTRAAKAEARRDRPQLAVTLQMDSGK